jgi:hypothetical protein
MKNTKKIHIILKNKLIALDAISPLLLHINKENKDIFFNIITFDEELINSLERNIILKKIVNSVGVIKYVGRYAFQSTFFSRIVNILWLLRMAFRVAIFKEPVIHFGMLNTYPLKILYLLNKENTYIIDKKAWHILLNNHTHSNNKIIEKCNNVAAKYSILFSDNSIYKKCTKLKKSRLLYNYEYYNPKKTKIWFDYIKSISNKYIDQELASNNLSSKRIITIIATRFGVSSGSDKFGSEIERDLVFFDILVSLSAISARFPIAIKEHIYSDVGRMKTVIRLAKSKTGGRLNCYLTKLHPSVLATRSVVGICHTSSATFYDFRCFEIPTIAITDYGSYCKNQSHNQTHTSKFIDANDLQNGGLLSYIENVLKSKSKSQVNFIENNSYKIINRLSK